MFIVASIPSTHSLQLFLPNTVAYCSTVLSVWKFIQPPYNEDQGINPSEKQSNKAKHLFLHQLKRWASPVLSTAVQTTLRAQCRSWDWKHCVEWGGREIQTG